MNEEATISRFAACIFRVALRASCFSVDSQTLAYLGATYGTLVEMASVPYPGGET